MQPSFNMQAKFHFMVFGNAVILWVVHRPPQGSIEPIIFSLEPIASKIQPRRRCFHRGFHGPTSTSAPSSEEALLPGVPGAS
ncbi:hypothetical protein SEVIR_9G291350v4 [Setaria viridis]